MKKLLTFFMVVLFSGPCYADMVTTLFESTEVRSSFAIYGSEIVFKAPRHYPLSVNESKSHYIKVEDFRGGTGWIHESWVDNEPGVVIKVSSANVRLGGAKEYPVVFKASKGESFKVLDEKDDWLEISDGNGKSGWVWKPLTWGLE